MPDCGWGWIGAGAGAGAGGRETFWGGGGSSTFWYPEAEEVKPPGMLQTVEMRVNRLYAKS